jgi:hypothetical protein
MQKKFLATVLRNGFFLKAALSSVLLMVIIVCVTGCNNDSSASPENSILGIALEDQDGGAVWIGSVDINEELATVTLTVFPLQDVTSLIPKLQLSPGAGIVSTRNGQDTPLNFTRPQTFRIQAEDGSIRSWTIWVTELAADSLIIGVSLKDSSDVIIWKEAIEIDLDKKQILITVAEGAVLTGITPELTLSPGAKLVTEIPGDGGLDFTRPQNFTVEAQDGSRQEWTVAIKKNNGKDITGISLRNSDGAIIWEEAIEIDGDKKHILITVAKGTALTGITPTLELSADAKLITEIPDAGLDFNQSQTFTVEAQDGSRQEWTVAIKRNDGKGITGISLKDSAGSLIWEDAVEIDRDRKHVLITVAKGTTLTGITPILELSTDAKLVTEIPDTGLDFNQIQTFTVEAQDGSQQEWTVAIKKNDGKDITGLSLKNSDGNILLEDLNIDATKKHILITVAKGTALTGITPILELSTDAKLVTEIPDTGLDFNQLQTFTVEAQDGSRQEWTVAIKKNDENDITGIISLKNSGGSILILSSAINTGSKKIVLTVPRNTDIRAVTPELELSTDAKLITEIPEGGLDFTRAQTLIVEAQDGTKQKWTVEVAYDTSSIIGLNVELAGTYDIKFGFSYPNHKEVGGQPDYTQYEYDIKAGNPIKLSYFITDNAIYNGITRKTYYNTLVVNAAGFTNVTWHIDGRAAPSNNSTESVLPDIDNILTIRAQDWTLENTHTVVFIGTRNGVKYSGTFEFKVVEIEEANE